jgi:acetolactate synthase-1/2/3 large subunit
MIGADRLCAALLTHGVDTCFAYPGTSEMHFVAALDRRPDMRCVLGLFEGVVTGAADGYGRMTERPAVTLLHLGPGLANGLANLHNARRAGSPIINIVGEHSTDHLPLDAPLTSDIESLARPMSTWVHRVRDAHEIERDVAEAWTASMKPGIATIILPAGMAWADVAWTGRAPPKGERGAPPLPDRQHMDRVVAALRSGRRVGLVLSGKALKADALEHAGRIASAAGARLLAQGTNGRIERGRGRVPVSKIPYAWEAGRRALDGLDMLVLVGAREPTTFFGYPEKSGRLLPRDCELVNLAQQEHDLAATLEALADAVGPRGTRGYPGPVPAVSDLVAGGDDRLTAAAVNRLVAARLPENAIVCDEAISSAGFYEDSFGSAPHDYLQITGGAIGVGIPMATGAAIACPDRRVITLQADGSAMYTLQGLWTQARERLDVVTIVFANHSYAILHGEMRKVGVAELGRNAQRMLDLDDPRLSWVKLATGMGVPAESAKTVSRFSELLDDALRNRGPFLIEAVIA